MTIAPIECEHVRIGAVIENRLERGPTLLRDADDQHVVIIPYKLQLRASGIARRRTEKERDGGVLSSASDDDGGGLQARCASSYKTLRAS